MSQIKKQRRKGRSLVIGLAGLGMIAVVGAIVVFFWLIPAAASDLGSTDIKLAVSLDGPGRPISPYIYGVASASPPYMSRLGTTLNRWGGNPASRFNWEIGNAWNAARDYFFANTDYNINGPGERQPGGAPDGFQLGARREGAVMLLTIPALGYVAKDTATDTRSVGVPTRGGPGLDERGAIAGYDPTANRQRTSVPMFPTKKGPLVFPPDLKDGAVYADEWVHHLVERFGPASAGGVAFYTIDNEPDLWAETHTDVQPALPGYDLLLSRYLDYAGAVRSQDATARLTGPALSSPARIFDAPLDKATGGADRQAHGGETLLEWWLKSVRASDERQGRRSLDVLDVHYYPGKLFFNSKPDDQSQRRQRLEATRALWDETFEDAATGYRTKLIPRLHEMADRLYPGTGVGIGEWNFGGESDISGALATADALGIFGEQDLTYAAYWTFPPEGSPAFWGFKLFCNYNDRGGRFGDLALGASSSNRRRVALYAARRSSDGAVTLVAINKGETAVEASLALNGLDQSRPVRAEVRQYSPADLKGIRVLSPVEISPAFKYTLPALSITLFELNNANSSHS